MRTIFLSLAVSLLIGSTARSQSFTNTDFEGWTFIDTAWNGDPIYQLDGWEYLSGVFRSDESYSGHYAALLTPMLSCGMMRNMMIYGTRGWNVNYFYPPYRFDGCGAPVNFKPNVLSGFYKLEAFGEYPDSAEGIVLLKKFNASTQQSEIVGEGHITFMPATEYTAFAIPVTDLQPGVTPDSVIIAFISGMSFEFDTAFNISLSSLYIDYLSLRSDPMLGLGGITEKIPVSVYPNPSRHVLNVHFETDIKDVFTFTLTDMNGKQLIRQAIAPGETLPVNTSSLPAGNYIGMLAGEKMIYTTQKIIVGEECMY